MKRSMHAEEEQEHSFDADDDREEDSKRLGHYYLPTLATTKMMKADVDGERRGECEVEGAHENDSYHRYFDSSCDDEDDGDGDHEDGDDCDDYSTKMMKTTMDAQMKQYS